MKPAVADKTDKTDKPLTKPAPKVFDIAHPGKSSASASGRPVIVTNRPILHDPMVSKPDAESLPGAPKLSPAESKVVIKPLDENDSEKTDDANKTIKIDKSSKNGDKTIAELAAEAIAGKAAKAEKEAAKEPEQDASTAEAENPDSKEEVPPELEAKQAEASNEKSDADSKSEGGSDELTVDNSKEAKETAALEAEAKKQEAINALAESRQYFLPINSVERHRSKIVSILGLVLIIALGLLLFDLLLDVGMVHINGVHAVTHFFSV